MKQRFSSLDVKVIAHELNHTITSLRVTNIYDLSTRIFLLKLHAPNKREQFLIDSGFRCHLTSFARTTAAAPSPFVQRLRKYLKSRRITSVAQVGTDRIIEIQFSDGLYRLFLEFYAGGNIVLTDGELKVISLLRNVGEGEAHEQLRVGLQYNLNTRQNYGGIPPLTKERVADGLRAVTAKLDDGKKEGTKERSKRKQKDALRKSLALSLTELPPMLIEHGLATVGFDKETSPEDVLAKESVMTELMAALKEAAKIVNDILSTPVVKGYIIQRPLKAATSAQDTKNESPSTDPPKLIYDDFHPFKPRQFEDDPANVFLEVEGFNKTVDEFYSSIEGQRLESRLHEREETARRKLEQARADHKRRIAGLQDAQQLQVRKAEAIEANLERVEEAKAAVNGLIGQGMDWVDIARLIETEQKRGNQVAQMIKLPLKLYENTVTLLLDEPNFDEVDEDDEGYETEDLDSDSDDEPPPSNRKPAQQSRQEDKRLAIDIDLALSSWANASQYYDQKRTAVKKEEKTLDASSKALKSAKHKIENDLKKSLKAEKDVLRPVRKQFWFEKFLFFISSEGYLVLGGKDAQQNDLLYRKYLRKGDIYVHADLHGASSVVIKNNPATPDAPIPPSTLSQAGSLSVCSSQAWESKAVMSAWWVHADQVSKTAPTGEYLKTGGFVIRGTKNFLPPAQLLLGFAVLFQISDDSKARHVKHRVIEAVSDMQIHDSEPVKSDNTKDGTETPAAEAADGDADTHKEEQGEEDDEDSDDDEDFPDVKLNDSQAQDEDGNESYNPLQATNAGRQSMEDEENNDATNDGIDSEEKLDASPDEDAEADADIESTTAEKLQKSTRHLSAHERRLLRKGIDPTTQEPASTMSGSEAESEAPSTAVTTASTMNSSKAVPRGKRGKQKKLATKYADQDDEDRELAMQLLGSKVGQERAKAEAEALKKKREQEEAQRQRRREQHLRVQAEAEEKRRRGTEGGDNEGAADGGEPDDDEEVENDAEATRLSLLGLDAFVGRPLPGDELLAAIPVCAPWATLGNYKYRVKLQPGTDKRGKAIRAILGKWDTDSKVSRNVDEKSADPEKMWPREVDLIKGWKEAEVLGALPVAKMKVMQSGGNAGGSGGKGKGKGGGQAKGQGKAKGGKGGKK